MADVFCNTNLVSSSSSCIAKTYQGKQQQGLKGFPLKLRPLPLRSKATSLACHFLGDRVPLHGNQGKSSGGGYLLQTSIKAQSEDIPPNKKRLKLKYLQKWWEKRLQPNMREVISAQDLVDSLNNAGDKLVVLDFFAPACGGCRALHPKICQLAELNPDVQFLQVNCEELQSLSYSLNVNVMPFFRLYRGAHGRLSSFSCTIATIKKLKEAIAKHSTDRSSIGPTKGLEEDELLALAASKDLNFTYSPEPAQPEPASADEEVIQTSSDSSTTPPLPPSPTTPKPAEDPEETALVASSGRWC